jgi:NAD(P)-dependent dehydrogenase (short-subunit alcohol dehydrogenase family)
VSLRECFNNAYDVNVAGTHVLTHTFIPLLLASKSHSPSPSTPSSPRLVFVAGLSQITVAAKNYFPTPPQPAGWPKKIEFETIGYRCSKVALNMLMLDWSFKLKEDGVMVWAVGPGFLTTDLGGIREMAVKMGTKHPSAGGRLLRSVVEGERDADVGKLINKDGISPF